MLSSTSPTISTPSSPAFHVRKSPYHAPRRPSSSSCASPRSQQVSNAPPCRSDAQTTVASQQSPVLSFARSPQTRRSSLRRSYRDSGTQYSPEGYPPTYRPALAQTAASTSASDLPYPQPTVPIERRNNTSATTNVTEPPEPNLRVDPRRVSREKEKEPSRILQTPRQNEAGTVSSEHSAPVKRSRPQNGSLKIMPLKYETCDVKDLGVLISDMLMELVRLNDDMPLRDGQLTRFHSRAPPAISVKDYLFRLIVHATLSPPILLSMVFYVDKLCSMYPAFTISSLTVHRFLITAATVAAKGLSDSFWTNSLYAKVGGVSVRELALLELEFLRKLDWRIVPKPEVLVDYYRGLVERGEGYVMEREAGSELSSAPESSAASTKIEALDPSTTGASGDP